MKNELQTLYFSTLEKLMSIEDQIIAHLPKMIDAASSDRLREVLSDHLEETRDHKARLEEIFSHHNHTPSGKEDLAFKQLLTDTEQELATITDTAVQDALIIASAQVVEHIEIAKYGTAEEWADELDDEKGEDLLEKTLEEEKNADEKLTSIAEGGIFRTGVNEKAKEE